MSAEDAVDKQHIEAWEREVVPGLVVQLADHPPETSDELDRLIEFYNQEEWR